ncbi:MAG: sulfatase-like hydrolase/transferase [Methyloceanibacter sp.]|nr:sulfatase-like hydrolase/transferase [Methyloceanibacter sp.]
MNDKRKSGEKPSTGRSPSPPEVSRRDMLVAGGAAAAFGTLPSGAGAEPTEAEQPAKSHKQSGKPHPARRSEPLDRPYNLVLFISDEEAYHLRPAEGYSTPGREELMRRGTTFRNHYIGAAMCTPSRGVMFSGQPPQVNGVFDQMELGYVPSLSTGKPSMGTVFKKLGYATAYYGKFELRRDIINPSPSVNYTDALKEFGFDRFAPDGDKVGAPDQGYDTDVYTGSEAVRWLRTEAQELNKKGQPWLLVVSFVSPHDIMYADANEPGSKEQVSAVGMKLTPPPDNNHFATKWTFPKSPSHSESLDAPGRPRAQLVYNIGWSEFLGEIPMNADAMWYNYYNYYLNLIRDNDRNLKGVIDALSALDLWDSTVVFRTADHGELGGSHGGLRGKGPLPYEQECHVPAVIVHPEHAGGRNCQALTSHIDLIPTLVGLTGADADLKSKVLDGLPGHDFSSLLKDAEAAKSDAIREAVLFNYVGLQTVDALYMTRVCRDIAEGRFAPPFSEAKPDMQGRGFISFVYDGRYKFARYYAPDNFNTPTTLEALLANNEIELFDLEADPDEVTNLGIDAEANKDLILRMNDLLNRMIAKEVGVNDGAWLLKAMQSY